MTTIHWEDFVGTGIFFGFGFLTALAERFWPLRTYLRRRALKFDILGFTASSVAGVGVRWLQSPITARVQMVPGLRWIPSVGHAVHARVGWPIALVAFVVILDFIHYLAHRLLHTTYLWHTHAFHHSVDHLYWFGGNRASPVHVALLYIGGPFLALVLPVYGGAPAFYAETIIYVCIQHFNHANLRWRLGFLEWLIVVPRYHFVHHGADPKLNDSNFGFVFTIWDRMFGTYVDPDSVPDDFPLGLNYEVGPARLLIGLPPSPMKALPAVVPPNAI